MKVIYIAGPYSAPNTWAREQNIRAAEAAGLQVILLGAMPLVPHTMTRFYFGAVPEATVIEGDLELLRRSDAVLFVGDWENSKGSMGELEEACRINLPRFFSIDQLFVWLRAQWFKGIQEQAQQELQQEFRR
jgi:hypothetical protein